MKQAPLHPTDRDKHPPGEVFLRWRIDPLRRIERLIHDVGLLPRLLVAEAIVLALLYAGSMLLIGQLADSIQSSSIHGWYLLGKSVAIAIDGTLANSVGMLSDSATWYREAMSEGQVDQAQDVLDLTAQHSPVFTGGVVVVGPNHRILSADRPHASLIGHDLGTSWPEPTSGAGSAPSILAWGMLEPGTNRDTVAVAVPLSSPRPGSYLVGIVDSGQSEIDRILGAAVQLGQSGHADLLDQQCHVLFSTEPGHLLGSGDHPTFCHQMLARGQAAIGEARTEEPESAPLQGPHVMAHIPLSTFPWALEIGSSTAEVYGPSDRLRTGSLVALVVFTGLAFLATTISIRKVVEPVTALNATARRIADGEYTETISTPWGGEIGELAQSLETMRVRLASWAASLEEQVEKRTLELEQRNRDLEALYESLRQQEAQRQDLLGRVLTAQEDERRRVSRELHDSIGQAFWALALNLERLQSKPGCSEELRAELESLRTLATESLGDLRRLTIALRPAALDDLGLVPAIRRYAELYLREANVQFEVVEHGLEHRLAPFLETIVYRVVQEAINNVARHSHAHRARIELSATADSIVATVEDDGIGSDLSPGRWGVGLQGMNERASLAGGKLTVTSAPGSGTIVTLKVPRSTLPKRGNDEQRESPDR
jgi:signal transduction histidine kinase